MLPSLGGVVRGPYGAGSGGLPCPVASLCLRWAGTKATFIGVAEFMKGVASILLWVLSAGCPCALAGDCWPVVVTVGVRGWRFGGAWRMGLVVLLPGCLGPLAGGVSPCLAGGVQGGRPLGRPPASRGLGGGERGERGGGAPRFPVAPLWSPCPSPRWLRGGGLNVPAQSPPCGWLCGAARFLLQSALPGLFGIPWRPGRLAAGGSVPGVMPAHVPRGRPGGGSLCAAPPQGRGWGAPGGGGRGSLCLGPYLGLPWAAPKRAASSLLSSWRVWCPYCSALCPRAAVQMRFAGCPCLPTQDYRPVVVTVGVGGSRFGGAWRMGLVALLPGCRGPLEGGGGLPWPGGGVHSRRPGGFGGRAGRGGGLAGAPPCPPSAPCSASPAAARGWLEGPCPDPPAKVLCGAARPPLHRALPGLFGIPGLRARPGWLAAVGSVPDVTPAHVPPSWPGRGGAVCVPPSPRGVVGAPRGAGDGGSLCLGPSLDPLPPPGGHQSGLHRRCPVHGGCGLHTAPVPVRALSSGCGPRGAHARGRRTTVRSRSLWEWAGGGLAARGVWA